MLEVQHQSDAFEFRGVTREFGAKVRAVDEVSFSLARGEFLGLVGLNGAGKSTLIRMLSTLLRPTSGRISLFEQEDLFKDTLTARAQIGLMPQEINLNPHETVLQTLLLQGSLYGLSRQESRARIGWLLSEVGLESKKEAQILSLSGGMKRRVLLVRALLHFPPLLILDEPSAGLDLESRAQVWHFLKKLNREGMTILLTSHYLEEIERLCSSVALMDRGRLKLKISMSELLEQRQMGGGWLLQIVPLSQTAQPFCTIPGAVWLDRQRIRLAWNPEERLSQGIERVERLGFEVREAKFEQTSLEELLAEQKIRKEV